MTELTTSMGFTLELLKDLYKTNIEYLDEILANPKQIDESRIEYLLRDNTVLNGYQNDSIVLLYHELKDIHDRILCNGGKQ
jgi:hypothetical protein